MTKVLGILSVAALMQAGASLAAAAESPRLLSQSGSNRATAYVESSKIIRFGDRAHVSWLEKRGGDFSVCIQTFDTRTGEASPIFTVGEAQDNHGGPALTVDADGFLHILYYPHHSPMRYRRSLKPNDASAWTAAEEFGIDLTYPAVVCSKDGTLIMLARRSFEERPWDLELWRKRPGQEWARVGSVLRARYGNYAQFAASLAWGSDHTTLHLATRVYEKGEWDGQEEPATTIGYLRSVDGGDSWTRADGRAVALPATAETVDRIAVSRAGEGSVHAIGSMAVSADGRPYVPYSVRRGAASDAYLATLGEKGEWERRHLNPYLKDKYSDWDLFMYGGVSIGSSGEALVAAVALPLEADDLSWAEPEMEIAIFRSGDGGESFSAELVGEPNPTTPRWLPNLERATGFNPMPPTPSLIFTEGADGESGNGVYWLTPK